MRTLALREVHGDDVSCVRRVPLFSALTPDQQDRVGTLARPMMLSRGELLHGARQQPGRLYVVHSGEIKLSRPMPSGRQRLLRVVGPGETLGEHSFLTRSAIAEVGEALSDTRLCVFSHDDLAGLVSGYPGITMRMLNNLSERLAQTEEQLALNMLNVDIRVADYLLQQPFLDHKSGPGTTPTGSDAEPRVQLPLSKKDIASLLGTTPESLSRALARLEANKLIAVQTDVVRILDAQGLEDLVTRA